MKKYFLITTVLIFTIISMSYSYGATDNSPTIVSFIGYPLYEYNVSKFCSEFKNAESGSEFVYLTDTSSVYKNLDKETSDAGDFSGEAKDLYRKNMDGVYNCATSIINLKAYERVKKELGAYKNQLLMAKIAPKVDGKISQIQKEIEKNENRCKINSANDENIIKKNVLMQGTYEYCRYMYYLEYLKEYSDGRYGQLQYTNTGTLNDFNSIFAGSIGELAENALSNKNKISEEISNTEKAFPIAYKAYSEYENNLVVHVLLELLRDDYIVLREQLHKTINPINQVVYKLNNAMRK